MNEIEKKFASNMADVFKLMESIKTQLAGYADNTKKDWGHIGTLEHIKWQLNNIDTSLGGYDSETVEKVWSPALNRYVTIPGD